MRAIVSDDRRGAGVACFPQSRETHKLMLKNC